MTDASSFTSVRYLSNQQTVQTSGIDVVATWPFELGNGSSTITFVGNWSDVELTKFSSQYTSENRRLQIERGRPDSRYIITWAHLVGDWRLMARTRYYGEYYDAPTNDGSVSFYPATGLGLRRRSVRSGDAVADAAPGCPEPHQQLPVGEPAR